MYHFFTEKERITEEEAVITGGDVNHIRNVLRMKPGEQIIVSDGRGTNRLCELTEIGERQVRARILPDRIADTELPVKVTLFQGLPKGDKMELIIQKCVELGVSRIVPLVCSRCVVRLDRKKEEARRRRWSVISESAAKQSGRAVVPEIACVAGFEEAMKCLGEYDLALIPYEDSEHLPGAGGMRLTRTLLSGLLPGQSCAVFIGPEGGFSAGEIELAVSCGAWPVTLGKRILRTETAGLFVLSAIGFVTEDRTAAEENVPFP